MLSRILTLTLIITLSLSLTLTLTLTLTLSLTLTADQRDEARQVDELALLAAEGRRERLRVDAARTACHASQAARVRRRR